VIESPIPTLPVPPMRAGVRDLIYGIWAWTGVILMTAFTVWSVAVGIENVPMWVLAVFAGHTAFGTFTGFVAKRNVTYAPQPSILKWRR